ncbi:MAG: phosphopentomutase [bacterium]|nr:phosphopentomutase [bacterium]
MINRFILIVLDSVGIGALPDARLYGDEGSNTLVNLARAVGGLSLPNLARLGLGNITSIKGIKPQAEPEAAWGKMAEKSVGKDTTTGHWEIAGLVLDKPFPLYPNGFPEEVIKPFSQAIGRDILGNKSASGTEIIKELCTEHLKTGFPIVYTSADSVFQIAGHIDTIPIEELYRFCKVARKILVGQHDVGRVIARPFAGKQGEFKRINGLRKDYSLPPPCPTILNALSENGFSVIGIGKINDIFAGSGISRSIHTDNNFDGINKTIEAIKAETKGLIFTNLIDFDMVYGHRNDAKGYAKALEEFDNRLVEIIEVLKEEDILILTADHGCDPTTKSTDHSREYVPLIVYGSKVRKGINLGIRKTFADISATISHTFNLNFVTDGNGFEGIFYHGEN